MRNLLFVLALMCIGSIPVFAIDTIPDVKTLADLRRLPTTRTADGFDVRVGIADPGDDAGPFKLIYCLADRKQDLQTQLDQGEYKLGPLGVDLVSATDQMALRKDATKVSQRGNPQLYCQVLPVGWDHHLTVRVSSGTTVLYERNFDKSEHLPCYWTKFVADPYRAGLNKSSDLHWLVDQDSQIRCPSFADWTNLLESRAPAGPTTRPLPPDDTPLPGGLNLPIAWKAFYFPQLKAADPITLSLKDDSFIISDNGLGWHGSPASTLLARWWVNDQPVAVELSQKTVLLKSTDVLRKKGPVTVAFGLPKFLGPLKAGDRIGIQLLYSNELEFYSKLHQKSVMQKMMYVPLIPVPVTSNRLDFTLDDHLLSLAEK